MDEELNLTFQRYDQERERTTVVLSQTSVQETCEILRVLLGLPMTTYRLGIVRTGTLVESLDFSTAGIRQNDRLTLIPVHLIQEWKDAHIPKSTPTNTEPHKKAEKPEINQDSSIKGNEYQLLLTIRDSEEIYRYSVKLEEIYENTPLDFFGIPQGSEYQKFKQFLQSKLQKEASDSDSSRILKKWCNDISQGYRTTTVNISSRL
jgi:hypothetical protein